MKMLRRSDAPTLRRSGAPTLRRSDAPALRRSEAPTLRRSDAPRAAGAPRAIRIVAFAITCIAVLTNASEVPAAWRVYPGIAPPIYVEPLHIPIGSTTTLETGSPWGVDTVMHLLAFGAGGAMTEVEYNDDISWPSNVNSRIVFTNNQQTSSFVVVIRGYSVGTSGSTTFKIDGADHMTGVYAGGWMMTAALLTASPGDEVWASLVPGGSVAPMIFALDAGHHITDWSNGNGIAFSSGIFATSTTSDYLIGTLQVGTPSGIETWREGNVLVTSNDWASADNDDDHLGDGLEADLLTCSALGGCGAHTVQGGDTDRDGLSDFEELYGIVGQDPFGADDLSLMRWGASPRHKDVFLELDHVYAYPGAPASLTEGMNPFQWIRDHPSLPLGAWTGGTLEQWVSDVRAPFEDAPADQVHNPDGIDGVAVHLDLGIDPLAPSDEKYFGNWGDSSLRAVVQDQTISIDGPISGAMTVQVNTNGPLKIIQGAGLTTQTLCAAIAFSIIELADLGEDVTIKAGDCPTSGSGYLKLATTDETKNFHLAVNVPVGDESAVSVDVREDHGSLYHNADIAEIRSPVRRGTIRYGIIMDLNAGGQASGDRFASKISTRTVAHELGHTCGLEHYGHDRWGTAGTTCVPHYDSIMNYDEVAMGFSTASAVEGQGLLLEPHATREDFTFGPGYAGYWRFFYEPYNYAPWSWGATDWNRDDAIDTSPTGYRGLSLFAHGKGCDTFTHGATALPGVSVPPVGAPELQRFGGRLYALWLSGAPTHLLETHANLGPAGNKGCTGSANPASGAPCLSFSAPGDLGTVAGSAGVTALTYGGELVVATVDTPSGGQFRLQHFSAAPTDGALVLQATTTASYPFAPTSSTSAVVPELVTRHQAQHTRALGLVFLGQDGNYGSYGWTGSSWLFEGPLMTTTGTAIAGSQAPVVVSWPDSGTSWQANEFRTVAILPSATGDIRMFVLDYQTNRWRDIGLDMHGATTVGRPFLAFRTIRDTLGLPDTDVRGHFMVGWMASPSAAGANPWVGMTAVVSRTSPPDAPGVTLGSLPVWDNLGNSWTVVPNGNAVTLYSDGTVDNVFGLLPVSPAEGNPSGLLFLPHADGSPAQPLRVYSDFQVMEDFICCRLRAFRQTFNCGNCDLGTANVFN